MVERDIGFNDAIRLTMSYISTVGSEKVSILEAVGRVAAGDIAAVVDSPSVDASLKDGYAVISSDIAEASIDHPVPLFITAHVAAGDQTNRFLKSGEAIRILTGAPLPEGAQAVLSEEFTLKEGTDVYACADAHPGRNILEKGSDVSIGQILVKAGEKLTPQRIGLLIAGGLSNVLVYKKPKIGLLATGSEVILPDQPMRPGKVYASNLGCQQAWLNMLGYQVHVLSAVDSMDRISEALQDLSNTCDIVVTSGGAWKGDRDLMASVLDAVGGNMVFHRLWLGPGKATGMGVLNSKPVFCLPGGPSSNLFGFILIVLPAIFKISGKDRCPYLTLEGTLESAISGQSDWTNLVQCDIIKDGREILLRPRKLKSRLFALASQPAVVVIPEGVEKYSAGETVSFICLDTDVFKYRVWES